MPQPTTQAVAEDPASFRLPTYAVPLEYAIHLTADPKRPDFDGRVRITLKVQQETKTLVLHSKGLDVESAVVESAGAKLQADVSTQDERETIELRFDETIPAGEAILDISYTGKVGQAMAGLYHSADGAEECLATQCEATDARRILPCFDEPAFKARFQWTVTTGIENTVLANGPIETNEPDQEAKTATWRFKATEPMASYLAAVAIGQFKGTDEKQVGDVPFRVWALGGKERLGVHARDFSARLLPWYDDYFGVDYAFGKYDQLAVPSFSFGAMENVGLVVFRSSLLLTDPKTTSWQGRKTIDMVVAHEFAHMWFGNLVTMRWWDDLWLNEAFAEWIAHKAVGELEPSHDIWLDFQDRTFGAMETDALKDTHAIYNKVDTPAEAREMFDAITYGKGSAVLRMLEAYLGEDAFRKGLQSYMREFRFKNARGADLWSHLGKASKEPVVEIMDKWLNQPGHPVVSVGRVGDEGLTLRLKQERARSSPKIGKTDQSWFVPLVIRYGDDSGVRTHRHLLTKTEETIDLPFAGDVTWLCANAQDVGFYRVDLDDGLRGLVVENYAQLEPSERTAFLRDQWGLVRNDRLPIGQFLRLVERLATGDDHYTVVDHHVGLLRDVERLLEHANNTEALQKFRAWTAARFTPALETIGITPADDEPEPERQRRASILRAVAAVGRAEDTVALVVELADAEGADPSSVDPNLAALAVSVAALTGDEERFDAHVGTYTRRRDAHAPPQEVDRYLYTMAAFRQRRIVGRVLSLIDDNVVPKQAVGPLLRIMLGEPHSQRAAWEYLRSNWSAVRSRVGDSWVMILVEASGQLPPDLRTEVVEFFEANLDGLAQQSFRRAKERLEEREELFSRILGDVATWAKALAPDRG